MKKALILIDLQNDYFPGGNWELEGVEGAGNNARDLLGYFRENNYPLFHIQHIQRTPNAPFFAPNTPGVEIHDCVKPASGEEVVQKHAPNSFLNTSLQEKLTSLGVEHVVLCGAMSHMCVDATGRAALDLGFNCTIVQDACATRMLEFKGKSIPAEQVHGAFMHALAFAGGQVVDLQEFLRS